MIGGMGEKKTLRLVAQYADACNLFVYGGEDVIRQKLDVLRGHCEDIGRDYDEIERTGLESRSKTRKQRCKPRQSGPKNGQNWGPTRPFRTAICPRRDFLTGSLGTVNLAPDAMSADEVIEQCRTMNDAGIQHLIFNMPNVHEVAPLETFGEKIIPAVENL